jgi:hypothetical protein
MKCMRTLILILFALFAGNLLFSQSFDPYTCTCKGKKLFGSVRSENSSADFSVKIVTSGEDLAVDTNDWYPGKCGEWKFVKSSPDFTVRFVTSGEDFTIRYVSYDPGVKKNRPTDFEKKINPSLCTFRGIRLNGKVKIVTSFPDIKVQVVENFPDLEVKMVENFPDHCGEWQLVDDFPDFTVQFVTSFPDIRIKYVTNFPGVK